MLHRERPYSKGGLWTRYLLPWLIVISVLISGCVKDDSPKPALSLKPTAQNPSEEQLDRIASKVATLRGLSPKTEIRYTFITAEELQRKLMEMVKKELPVEETRIETEILALLGLLEEGRDLRRTLLDLYAEQIMGFYDTEARKLFVVSDAAELGPIEEITFVHEYTHALQDQYFDLEAFLPHDSSNTDLDSARRALAEGDATAVQLAYVREAFNIFDALELLAKADSLQTEKFDAAPRYLQETLMFPYEAGFEFVNTFNSFSDLNRAYAAPPESTEQILHPEAYWIRDEPQPVDLSSVSKALEPDWAEYDGDVWGELKTRIYLETFMEEGATAGVAGGWDGDQYLYLKNAAGRKLFILQSVWDSPADAGEFWAACSILRTGDSKGWRAQDAIALWWTMDRRNFFVEWSSNRTLLIISEDEEAIQRILSALP